MMEITDEMVERLAQFLQSEWAGPYYASVREFMPEERPYRRDDYYLAIRALQKADREAEAEARRVARMGLEAAFDPRVDEK